MLKQNEECDTITCSVSSVTGIDLLQSCCKKYIGMLFASSGCAHTNVNCSSFCQLFSPL